MALPTASRALGAGMQAAQADDAVMHLHTIAASDFADSLIFWVEASGVFAELGRRMLTSATERFIPVFDQIHSSKYPLVGKAFPVAAAAGDAGALRQLLATLAVGLKVRGDLVGAKSAPRCAACA